MFKDIVETLKIKNSFGRHVITFYYNYDVTIAKNTLNLKQVEIHLTLYSFEN